MQLKLIASVLSMAAASVQAVSVLSYFGDNYCQKALHITYYNYGGTDPDTQTTYQTCYATAPHAGPEKAYSYTTQSKAVSMQDFPNIDNLAVAILGMWDTGSCTGAPKMIKVFYPGVQQFDYLDDSYVKTVPTAGPCNTFSDYRSTQFLWLSPSVPTTTSKIVTPVPTPGSAIVPIEGSYKLETTRFTASGSKCLSDERLKTRFIFNDDPIADRDAILAQAGLYTLNIERPRAKSTFIGNAPCAAGPAVFCAVQLYFTPFDASKNAYVWTDEATTSANSFSFEVVPLSNDRVELSWIYDGCTLKNTAKLSRAGKPTSFTQGSAVSDLLLFDEKCQVKQGANLVYKPEHFALVQENYGCVPQGTTTTPIVSPTATPCPAGQIRNGTSCQASSADGMKLNSFLSAAALSGLTYLLI